MIATRASCRPTRSDFENGDPLPDRATARQVAARLIARVVGRRQAHQPLAPERRAQLPGARQRRRGTPQQLLVPPEPRRPDRAGHLLDRARARLDPHAEQDDLLQPQRAPELLRLHGLRLRRRLRPGATTRPGRRRADWARRRRLHAGRRPHRFEQNTNALVCQGRRRQPARTRDQQLKVGGEMQLPKVTFGAPGYLVYTTTAASLVRHVNEPPRLPRACSTYHADPRRGLRAGPDGVERPDGARSGCASTTSTPASTVPSDLGQPGQRDRRRAAVARPGARRRKVSVAPRLGRRLPDHGALGHALRLRPLLPVPAARRHLHERRLLDPRRPAGRRDRQLRRHGQPGRRSPSGRCSTSSATSRRCHERPRLRPERLLQGHPRPARRRVHHDLQRRRVLRA